MTLVARGGIFSERVLSARGKKLPTYVDPHWGTTCSWKNRRDSVVTITGNLPLYDHGWLPIVVKIHRTFLASLLRENELENEPATYDRALLRYIENGQIDKESIKGWSPPEIRCYFFCEQIALLFERLDKGPLPRREKKVSIPVFSPPENGARFLVLRSSFPLIRKFFSNPPPNGLTPISVLTVVIQAFLFSTRVLTRVNSPSHGRKFKKQLFLDLLRSAYFTCNELVVRAEQDEETREEISKLLAILQKDDDLARVYLKARAGDESWDRFVAPCLVYWGFYGAWEKFGIAPFQTPDDLSRQYMYGPERERMANLLNRTKRLTPDLLAKTHDRAKELYLGRRGAAAKVFDLI